MDPMGMFFFNKWTLSARRTWIHPQERKGLRKNRGKKLQQEMPFDEVDPSDENWKFLTL